MRLTVGKKHLCTKGFCEGIHYIMHVYIMCIAMYYVHGVKIDPTMAETQGMGELFTMNTYNHILHYLITLLYCAQSITSTFVGQCFIGAKNIRVGNIG